MENGSQEKRRSRWYPVRIRAAIRGLDAKGRPFFHRAQVISVNAHGARVQWLYPLLVGEKVELQLAGENETRPFLVISCGEPGSPDDKQADLELAEAGPPWNLEGLIAKWGIDAL